MATPPEYGISAAHQLQTQVPRRGVLQLPGKLRRRAAAHEGRDGQGRHHERRTSCEHIRPGERHGPLAGREQAERPRQVLHSSRGG